MTSLDEITIENVHDIKFKSYSPILDKFNIEYKQEGIWLTHNTKGVTLNNWVLFISAITKHTIELLEFLLPIIKLYGVSFRIVKDELTTFNLNAGTFGFNEIGKVITIFPENDQQAARIADDVLKYTEQFKGPVVNNALRIGKVLYGCYCQQAKEGNIATLYVPRGKKFPVKIEKKYLKKRARRILGKYYIPISLIRSSPKGDILKGINLKRLSFSLCLIKQGKSNTLDDYHDRDMSDRLLWQQYVLNDLAPFVRLPKALDYFSQDENHYLIMEYIEGEGLTNAIRRQQSNIPWKNISKNVKIELLTCYLKILTLIEKIHSRGYIHRDITDTNFIIQANGEIAVLDFELSYSIKKGEPSPPFILGTPGYVAPEQWKYASPTIKEDVYSLGALLTFILTGVCPKDFIETDQKKTMEKLSATLESENPLFKIILNSLDINPSNRPEVSQIISAIVEVIENMKNRLVIY